MCIEKSPVGGTLPIQLLLRFPSTPLFVSIIFRIKFLCLGVRIKVFFRILEDMAVYVVCLLLLLAMVASSDATYCLCNTGVSNTVLQENIDYACGNGADCSAILQNGSCFLPNTIKDHCNYAVNSYYQRKGQTNGSCDFKGSASVSQTPPSNLAAGCVYQSSPSNGSIPAPPFRTPPNAPPGSGSFGPLGSFVPPSGLDSGTCALLSRKVTTSILACFLVNFLIYGLKWQRI